MMKSRISLFVWLHSPVSLAHFSLETRERVFDEQFRPRSVTIESGVLSVSALFDTIKPF